MQCETTVCMALGLVMLLHVLECAVWRLALLFSQCGGRLPVFTVLSG